MTLKFIGLALAGVILAIQVGLIVWAVRGIRNEHKPH